MTITNCENCGGTHYGSIDCPYLEKNMGEPCVICTVRTSYCCADCRIDGAGKVYVCVSDICRREHEKKHCKSEGAATPSASLEEEAKLAAVKFANLILDAYWPDCNDIDGAEIQELGIKSGVMQEVPGGYDPEKHGESVYDAEPGDTWYVAHPGLALLTSSAAPQAQAAPPPNLEPQCGVGEAEAFAAWWHEVENFSLRSERAIDDMRNDASYFLPRWMRAAFNVGFRAAQATVGRGPTPTPIDDGAVERGNT